MSKALTKEHVRKHYSSGAVAYYESGEPVRMMTPEESAYAAQRFDEWLAEVERAAAEKAWDRAEGAFEEAHNADMLEPWPHLRGNPYRAHAAEIREGKS